MWIRAGSGRVLLEAVRTRFFDLVGRIELGFVPPVPGLLSDAAEILNFDAVSRDLERALASTSTTQRTPSPPHARPLKACAAQS